jgi:Tfp pilus assembly protein PilX
VGSTARYLRSRPDRWISERYGSTETVKQQKKSLVVTEAKTPLADSGIAFSDFASLFAAADPATDPEKALVGAFWQQVCQGSAEWDSFSVNKQLKHLGHGVGNITDALTNLIGRRPQLVIQTRKSGKEKQARKLYKLTAEGVKRVNEMASGTAGERKAAS